MESQSAAAAAAAAASFPSIVTETLKYLAAASGNHQMAAAFASSLASLGPVKALDYRSVAAAAAAAAATRPAVGLPMTGACDRESRRQM